MFCVNTCVHLICFKFTAAAYVHKFFLDILDTAHSSPKLSKARTTGTRQHIHIYICKQIHIKQPLTPKQIYADYTNIYMYVLTTRLA